MTSTEEMDSSSGSAWPFNVDEMEHLREAFVKFDTDKSGCLDEGEFTHALHIMGYRYNLRFISEFLKLTFDDEYASKKSQLSFEDFVTFNADFLPLHEQVLTKVEHKVSKKNLNLESNRELFSLLKYIDMENGDFRFERLDNELNAMRNGKGSIKQLLESPKQQTETVMASIDEQSMETETAVDKPIAPPTTATDAETRRDLLQRSPTLPNFRPRDVVETWSHSDLIAFVADQNIFDNAQIRQYLIRIIQTQMWNGSGLCDLLNSPIDHLIETIDDIQSLEYLIDKLRIVPSDSLQIETILQSIIHFEKDQRVKMHHGSAEIPNMDNEDENYVANAWKSILSYFDSDGDGNIDTSEMGDAMRALGIDTTEKQLEDLITQMDVDNSGKIDFSEFRTYYLELFERELRKGMDWDTIKATLLQFDADKSGFLDFNEFSFALRKISPHITDKDIEDIMLIADQSGEQQIEVDDFIDFLSKGTQYAQMILKKVIRAHVASPIEYLTVFNDMPKHFRTAVLPEYIECATNGSKYMLSNFLKPTLDTNGVTFENVTIHPSTKRLNSMGDNSACRLFAINDCSGVPLPASLARERIIERRVRVCLFHNDTPISNITTIPVGWNENEADQWLFGDAIWKESMSQTVENWNQFIVKLDFKDDCQLIIELCVVVAPYDTSPQNATETRKLDHSKAVEMTCGWTVLNLASNHEPISQRTHTLEIRGGSFRAAADISSQSGSDSALGSTFSMRKLGHLLTGGVKSMITLKEIGFNDITPVRMREFISWLPSNMLAPFSAVRVFKLFFEITADSMVRKQPMFEYSFQQRLEENVFLAIANRCNLLCAFIDEWNDRRSHWKLAQRRDSAMGSNDFIKEEFRKLIQQFMPILLHQKSNENPLPSLDQTRLSFVKQMLKGDWSDTLSGKQPTAAVGLVFAPFTTDVLCQYA